MNGKLAEVHDSKVDVASLAAAEERCCGCSGDGEKMENDGERTENDGP